MRWNLNIPKILHVYWGGTALPYLRYMTLLSFSRHNPDWEIILWQPKYPSSKLVTWTTNELNYKGQWVDTLPEALELPKLEQRFVDFSEFGISNETSEVHKSDYLRYYVLYTYGGVWSDMDIIYIDQIAKLRVNNNIQNSFIETFVCISPIYGHSIGFLMASKGNAFFSKVLASIKIQPEKYQCIGSLLLNEHYPTLVSISKITSVRDIGMEAVYCYDAKNIRLLYQSNIWKFKPGAIGLHWYAGHKLAGEFLINTNGGVINLPDNVLGNLIRRMR